MSMKEQVAHELDGLSADDLQQVSEYVAFLKFRARVSHTPAFGESQLAALYSAFADEDRLLAEEGISDYIEGLAKEDTR